MIRKAKNYDESLERAQRRAAGVYYTPQDVVAHMVAVATGGDDLSDKLLLDPCCGSGNFFVEALRVGFRAENIYGFDIDSKAVKIARARIAEISGFDAKNNIRVADFFDRAPKIRRRFDYIITNPPWGSQIDAKRRRDVVREYDAGRSVDSSSLVMLASLRLLCRGGVLSFLLPESFFNIGNFEDVRRKVLKLRITHLCDYGRPFKGLITRAQAIVLRMEQSEDEDVVACRYDEQYHTRSVGSFKRNPKGIINLWLSDEEAKVVDAIYSKPYAILYNKASWGMGIVTGDNAKFVSDIAKPGYIGVLRGNDLTDEGINPPRTYIPSDMVGYQQVAPREFYLAPLKIIYRFISSVPIFRLDTERQYILNSVNGFIPDPTLPVSCRRVAVLFNTQIIRWLFKSIFHTHKILRTDIESLPLHYEFKGDNEDDFLRYLGIERTATGSYKLIEEGRCFFQQQ